MEEVSEEVMATGKIRTYSLFLQKTWDQGSVPNTIIKYFTAACYFRSRESNDLFWVSTTAHMVKGGVTDKDLD